MDGFFSCPQERMEEAERGLDPASAVEVRRLCLGRGGGGSGGSAAATAQVLQAVAALEKRVWHKSMALGRENFEKELKRPNFFLLYAAASTAGCEPVPGLGSEDVIGYLILKTNSVAAHIQTVAVAAAWRRQGIGHRLMQSAVGLSSERRVGSITLQVESTNQAALALYHRLSFTLESTLKVRAGEGRGLSGPWCRLQQ